MLASKQFPTTGLIRQGVQASKAVFSCSRQAIGPVPGGVKIYIARQPWQCDYLSIINQNMGDAMPLPVGTWTINANGSTGALIIGSGSGGSFNGTALGQPLSGFFNETDQEFSFIRVTSADISSFEIYHGTLFSFSPNVNTLIYTLGGTFRTYPPAGAVSPFEWSAQLSQKLKEKEGKDGKDKEQSKDNKDAKDRKDHKESGKEGGKELSKEVGKELESVPQLTTSDGTATMDQLAQRLSAIEQAMAVGQAFISPAERPVVGAQAATEKKPT